MQFSISKIYPCALVALTLSAAPIFVPAQQEREDNAPPVRFSTASLCGNYGAIATYGSNVARALGFEVMDGHGKITGAAIVNQPGSSTTRSIASIGISGTYTINAQGMGTMNLTIALPGGGTANVAENFVITRSKTVDGVVIATEIQDAQEVPSAVIDDSSLVIHTYTLRGTARACSNSH